MADRLPPRATEWIDRDRPISVRFAGQDVRGYAGDTITSALWANGHRVLGRSHKYRRPRGLLTLSNRDANTLFHDVATGRTNLRGDTAPATAGMDLSIVNDNSHALDGISGDHRTGCLYATPRPPGLAYDAFERGVREMVGLGRVTPGYRHGESFTEHRSCDVLVIGGGISGIAAALAAAREGASVMLVEQWPRLGGSSGVDPGQIAEVLSMAGELDRHPNVEVLTSHSAVGVFADRLVPVVGPACSGEGAPTRMLQLRVGRLVLATGTMPQPAVIPNNDAPGVMLSDAAQRLIAHYAVRPCATAVLVTHRDRPDIARDLADAGVDLAEVVHVDRDRPALSVITDDDGLAIGLAVGDRQVHGDGVLLDIGEATDDNLLRQAGGRVRYAPELGRYVADELPPHVYAAGTLAGAADSGSRRASGAAAGQAAGRAELWSPWADRNPSRPAAHPFPVFTELIADEAAERSFVDWDEDVTLADFIHGIDDGFTEIDTLRRYIKFGTGISQGKHSYANALRLIAHLLGRPIGEAPAEGRNLPTPRPLYQPVEIGVLAGPRRHVVRRTPMHAWHDAAGAHWMPAGHWRRPAYYGDGPRAERIREEALRVRRGVGVVDVSTLGKIEVAGPDAVWFLERMYTGRFTKLAIGRTRYAVMLDRSGCVCDDGVIARLADDRFYLTTTTGQSDAVFREMKRWAMVWQADVELFNLTGRYAAFNVAGPSSREVMARLEQTDLPIDGMPYMGLHDGVIGGCRARAMRVGFVGEWGYEIHLPADDSLEVWEAVMSAGSDLGIGPFGVEAQRLLRMEKGHIIVGQDTDALTYPKEASLAWAVKLDKPYFLGQRSLEIAQRRPIGRALVGLAFDRVEPGLEPGESHLVIRDGQIVGRLTSVALSPTLEQWIALGYVAPDQCEIGTRVEVRVSDGVTIQGRVTPSAFYDPEGLRQKEPVHT